MAEYVLVFRQATRGSAPDVEQAWGEWFGRIGGQVLDWGHRVGQAQILGEPPTASDELGGYIVVTADNLPAAVHIAEGCPGLRFGGRVEVGAVVPAQQ